MSDYCNPHNTIRPDQLEDETGEPKEVWYDRIWETVSDGYLFLYSRGGNGRSASMSDLHLPEELVKNQTLNAEPYDQVEGGTGPTCCRDSSTVTYWKYKSPAVYPPGHKDICSYCIYQYVQWHQAQQSLYPHRSDDPVHG